MLLIFVIFRGFQVFRGVKSTDNVAWDTKTPLMDGHEFKMKACPLRFSFTKADRILKRSEYLALSKFGKKVQNTEFIAYFIPTQHSQSRLGVTVTKKVGQAVERNRIKRIVREFFRINRHSLSGRWDINIIAKRQSAGIRSEKAYQSLQNIFELISRYDGHQ